MPLDNGIEVFASASDEGELFAENFSKKSTLNDSFVFFPGFPFTNLKLRISVVTFNLGSKVFDPYLFQ